MWLLSALLTGQPGLASPEPASQAPTAVELRSTLETSRQQALQPLLEQIRRRLTEAKAHGDADEIKALAALEEEYVIAAYGARLPNFLWQSPAKFEINRGETAIRFVAFGDFGDGGAEQSDVAQGLRKVFEQRPFDFGITLGDNFYLYGMSSPADPRWLSDWEALYSPLGIKFYASLGNHDWYQPDSPAAEILYTNHSATWRMPSLYYSFTAGPVEFFAVNTEVLTENQLLWLKRALQESKATWKIVYGHHPVYAASRTERDPDIKVTAERLLPVLRGRADVYLAGHDHILAHMKPEEGVAYFIAGGGGSEKYPFDPHNNPRTLFAQSTFGFLTVDATPESLHFVFVNPQGRELYSHTTKKPTVH